MKANLLVLAITATGCLAALPAYASPAFDHPVVRSDTLSHPDDFEMSLYDGKSRQFTPPHFSSGEPLRIHKDPPAVTVPGNDPPPAAAPEIDPATATGALTLLAGGLALLVQRRRRGGRVH